MKKANIVKDIVMPVVVLTAICIIVTLLLSVTNMITVDKIAQINLETLAESQRVVLPQGETFDELQKDVAYKGVDAGGNTVGYVVVTSAAGYGGQVKVMTGIDASGSVTGVVILEHSETPGLGAKSTSSDFRDQFIGMAAEGTVQVKKDGGNVDAISGATITSRAVSKAITEAFEIYNSVKEGA